MQPWISGGCGHALTGRLSLCAQDPSRCTQASLTPSTDHEGAASRECSALEAEPFLPTISRLIVGTPQASAHPKAALGSRQPWHARAGVRLQAGRLAGTPHRLAAPTAQLVSFANALRNANLSSIPGQQVTGQPAPPSLEQWTLDAGPISTHASTVASPPAVFAPSNQAFNAAVSSGRVTQQQLQVQSCPCVCGRAVSRQAMLVSVPWLNCLASLCARTPALCQSLQPRSAPRAAGSRLPAPGCAGRHRAAAPDGRRPGY